MSRHRMNVFRLKKPDGCTSPIDRFVLLRLLILAPLALQEAAFLFRTWRTFWHLLFLYGPIDPLGMVVHRLSLPLLHFLSPMRYT